ncbi:hypothetical protein DL93DRAFT_447446 [Clavulina sp. PMI_390]|nr:hypothetical protein DL93DRAFT_447446 [Clavulina sp. PMI_390]
MPFLLFLLVSEEQKYKKVPTEHAERKEPRHGRLSARRSPLRSLGPQVHQQRQHQHPPPTTSTPFYAPSANSYPPLAASHKQQSHRVGIVVAMVGVIMLLCILILIVLMGKLHGFAAISAVTGCQAG